MTHAAPRRFAFIVLFLFAAAPAWSMSARPPVPEPEPGLQVPQGFVIHKVASVPNARAMVWGDDGTLFVSTMTEGSIFAVRGEALLNPVPAGASDAVNAGGDSGSAARVPEVIEVARDLKLPTGIAFADGALYVAEPTRILRFDGIEARLNDPPEPVTVVDGLQAGKLHGWKTIAFGPDGMLYVAVGAPCNVCDEPDTALIFRMQPDGSGREVVAEGIRNTVGFDWHPRTGELWFTDNNRDMLGDDRPPCELNRVAEEGAHYGFPFCHGTDIVEPDSELAALGSCAESVPPAQELGPHVAPLGMTFYTGRMFPREYRNQVFIAEHGSWNRSEKIGYRLSLVRLTRNGRESLGYESFADGWLTGGEVSGRPADVINAPDGSLLMSDDRSGSIYRISYHGRRWFGSN